jgi:predicted MFS family arabinose efflux permease
VAADAGGEPVSRRLVLLLAVTCGAAVANLYDIQPLLNVVGDAFGVSDATVGLPVTCAQLGYLAGPALLVPLSMAGFSALWTSIAFLLAKPPYGYGEGVIGLFGLAGLAGALVAPLVGRLADRGHDRVSLLVVLVATLASWALLALGSSSLAALIAGIVVFDAAFALIALLASRSRRPPRLAGRARRRPGPGTRRIASSP